MESPAARAAALQGRLVQACAPAAAAARPYLGLSPVRLLEALRTAGVARPAAPASCPAARCPRLRRPRGPAAPEGPGRDSLPGDRLAGTKPPANPQRAWEEAAVIRLVTAGTALSSRAENEELAFGGGAGV